MINTLTTLESFKTAVLFLVFNRPETTAHVFEAIRLAKPARLYVAADGPRANRPDEVKKVEKVREIATAVDWPCEVKTLFRENNLGCKYAVSNAITWFFEQEEQGIILEDDCVPHSDFFRFCDTLLGRYFDDERVSVITGNNFQNGLRRGDASYYFSKYSHCWGWATWRRAWKRYQGDLPFWPEWQKSAAWKECVPVKVERSYWGGIFERVYRRQIESSWAYPWIGSLWFYNGLTATPNVNLVRNIGFGPDSTHTNSATSSLGAIETADLGQIIHPEVVSRDILADTYTFDCHYGGNSRRFPFRLLGLPRRVGGLLRRSLNRYLN